MWVDGDKGRIVGSPGITSPFTAISATASSVIPRILRAIPSIENLGSWLLAQGVYSGYITDARILQLTHRGPQGVGRVLASYQPLPTQCLCSYVSLQDGNGLLDSGFNLPDD